MKKSILGSLFFICACIFLTNCTKRQHSIQDMPLSAEQLARFTDSTLSNNEMHGQFIYTHLKYYLGTVDLTKTIQTDERELALSSMEACTKKLKSGMSYDRIIDELVTDKRMTENVGSNLKDFQRSVQQFINAHPDANSKAVWDYCLTEEKKVRNNTALAYDEKNDILLNHSLIRYTLKWKLEQEDFKRMRTGSIGSNSVVRSNSSFWSSIACFLSTVSSYAGYAIGFVSNKVVGAILGAAAQYINSVFSCNGTNTNVCQDPLSVSFPYACYTYGDPLECTAVGYGNPPPTQFDFDFRYNNNLNNHLYWNFDSNPYHTIPGSYLTTNVTDIAVQCVTDCSNGNPLWFGWFNLSDLGKPYFVISGTSNLTVADANYYPNFQYTTSGQYEQTSPSVQWQIIPSGYPNYSATGTILSSNANHCIIDWDATAGFATVKCTMTVSCGSVIRYFSVHIQN